MYFDFGSLMLFLALFTSLPLMRNIWVHFFSLFAAICFLTIQYVSDNFVYEVVYLHSNKNLPFIYKLTALWSSYEGSMLLWSFVLAFYNILFNFVAKIDDKIREIAINIQSTVSAIFMILLLIINPFLISKVSAINGVGLSPSLQDYMFTIHPPFLYFGYVGFSMIFAIALSILIYGKFTKEWSEIIKTFILIPIFFLIMGIVLGMWWSYRELGWGGIWSWDPVENVSLMPLILAISLLHSIIIVKKYNNLKNFSLFLCVVIFNVAIIGTFISRSGALNSVHAFAENEANNIYVMIVLLIVSISSFGIFLYKLPKIENNSEVKFAFNSRLALLILANILFVFSTTTILFGTLTPFIAKQVANATITIDEKYYNSIFQKITLIVLILIAVAPRIHWVDKLNVKKFLKDHLISISTNLIIFFIFIEEFLKLKSMVILLTVFSLFLIIEILENFCRRIQLFTLKWSDISKNFTLLSKSYYSTNIAHFGIGTMILSLCLMFSGRIEIEKDIKIGEYINISGNQILMQKIETFQNKNFEAIRGLMIINKKEKLLPEYRFYKTEKSFSSKSDTVHLKLSDIIVNITSFNHKNNMLSVNIIYNPYIQLLWLSIFFILVGICISIYKNIKMH